MPCESHCDSTGILCARATRESSAGRFVGGIDRNSSSRLVGWILLLNRWCGAWLCNCYVFGSGPSSHLRLRTVQAKKRDLITRSMQWITGSFCVFLKMIFKTVVYVTEDVGSLKMWAEERKDQQANRHSIANLQTITGRSSFQIIQQSPCGATKSAVTHGKYC